MKIGASKQWENLLHFKGQAHDSNENGLKRSACLFGFQKLSETAGFHPNQAPQEIVLTQKAFLTFPGPGSS